MLQDHENFDVDAAFDHGLARASQLWTRLGEQPDFRGKDVLEVGSGLGFMSAHIARSGARSVLGVDGVTGFLVDTAEEAVAAVARLPEIDRAACRAHVAARFSVDRMADRYLELYGRLLA